MMTKINFFALGGQDEKGKNCYILENDQDIFMIDIGIKNPIISKLGIDTIIPNFNYIKLHLNNFKGVFISSAHDYSLAALPWLLKQVKGIKIYTSKFVSMIIKERLAKHKIPTSYYQLIVIHNEIKIGSTNIKVFELAGSMPNTIGFNFQTSQGDILYMSSFVLNKLVDYCGRTNLNEIKNIISDKGVLFLAMESASANYHGYANEKALIRPLIEQKIKNFNDRIIIVAYDESMSTLQEILQLAIDYNKPIIIYGKSFALSLKEWISIYPNMKLPQMIHYTKTDISKNAIILVTGTGAHLYQRLDRIAENKDKLLKLKNSDLVMVIAPPINGHEKFASRAEDKVAEITTHLIDISRENFYDVKPADQDIKKTLEILKPKYFLPIRGLYCYLSTASKLAKEVGMAGDKVIILQNYKKVLFENGKLISQSEKIKDTNEIIIDGLGIGDVAPSIIMEREILGRDGLIIATILLNRSTHKLEKNIKIQLYGVILESRKEEFLDVMIKKINYILENPVLNNNGKVKWNFRETQNSIRKICQSTSRKQLSKVPIIMVNLFEI